MKISSALIFVGKDVEADDAGANEAAQTKIRGGMRRAQLLPDHKVSY